MAGFGVSEWTLDGVLDEMGIIHRAMKDRQFAFILGAGASFTSGIPTGQGLAQKWLKDLHLRECVGGRSLNEWIPESGIGDGTLDWETAAEHYPQIFERRFEGDREAGYAELEAAMEGKSPSLGYSLLAEIIQHTRHKVVVTTNFDNLVADALAMHAHQSPLVVAHESLAGFVRPQMRRPLVAKIHRDLYLHPINDPAGVSTMEQGWKIALKKLFQYFTPVVVGYGGNDGSLMDMLMGLNEGDIAGRIIWCYREGSPPPEKALRVLAKHHGLLVKIPGFDEFMLQLAAKLVTDFDVADIAERTAKLGQERADRYRQQASKLRESSIHGSPAEQRAGEVITKSLRSGQSWWAWEMKAKTQPDVKKRNDIYLEGMKLFPTSVNLAINYAIFLKHELKDYNAAELIYKKVFDLDPNNVRNIGSYANFLAVQRRDYASAQEMYKKALEIEPNNVANATNYGNFLAEQIFDFDAAERLFKKSLEIDPSHLHTLRSYAKFIADARKNHDAAEILYQQALNLAPIDENIICDYANFLADDRKDYDAADVMYKKALELNPSNARVTSDYANFLADDREDYDQAEEMYKRALGLDPNDVLVAGDYATFLKSDRKDYDRAEIIYKDALKLDPSNVRIINSFANFLAFQRKDFDAAEAIFKKALELNPNNKEIASTYSDFLANNSVSTTNPH
ncbi:tetratricopeptide repeat protein [Pseudomonas protegens]|uniref:tetratricopeptide repeat protein n=1 Tax=Pseudomonas protegens TaxID=380021 RepID=UPI0031585244